MKPPVSSCSCRSRSRCLDALGQRLDVAEHHGAGRTAAQLVPDAMDFEPFVGQALVDGDGLADAVDQDLAAAAGQAAQAGVLEPLQHLAQRQLVELVEVPDLRRAEGVQVDLRDSAPCRSRSSSSYHSSFKRRVHAALHQDLIAAQGDRLLDLLVEHLARQDVGIGIAALAVEGAEVADGGADVGVVDVAVDVVGAIRLGMQPAADGVGGPAQGGQVAAVEQGAALPRGVSRSPSTAFAQDAAVIGRIQGSPPARARPSSQASM